MYDYKAKEINVLQNNQYMLTKTLSMFEYSGLPETLPYREIERLLQTKGHVFITKHGEDLYAFCGGLGGVPDVYGNPTEIVITNPALGLNKTYNIKTDGVLIRSDDMGLGLIPLLNKYHFMLVENDINMIIHGYNSRIQSMISASDDKTKVSAEKYIENLIAGDLGVIGESALFDGVKKHTASGASAASVTQLIELQQYVKASLFNELGLGANFNMKRERLTSGEVDQGDDILYPFVDNMMKCRIKGFEAVNALYGTNIEIDYGSVWNRKNKEMVDDILENSGGEKSNESLNESTDEPKNEPEDETLSELSGQQSLELLGSLEKEIEEIKKVLLDESLTDEDRLEWVKLLEELEGGGGE